MPSILSFAYNLSILGLAWIFNLWIESYAYWFFPDAVFLMVVWLQFVSGRINYLALVLVALISDVYLENIFGSYLLATSLVVYFMGILNFNEQTKSPILGSVILLFYYFVLTEILLFINAGFEGILEQFILFTISKSTTTATAWMIMQILFAKRQKRLIDL